MFRVVAAAVLICPLLLLAQAASVERAWQLAGEGRSGEAVQLLQSMLRDNPDNADARLLLGSLLNEAGRHEEAITQLTAAVRLRPKSSEALNALGEAYLSFGDREAARRSFENAVSINPRSGISQLNLGRVLLETEHFDTALPHLTAAVATLGRDSDGANAHYLRAKVHLAQNNPKSAIRDLQQALAIEEAFAEAWSDLGQARKLSLDHAGALAAFQHAVTLSPDDAVAQYRLGEEYLTMHQPDAAIAPLQEADRLHPTDQSTLHALLRALTETRRTAEANAVKERLTALLQQRETSAENELKAIQLNDEGAQLQSAGDLRGALEKYSAAVQLSPDSVPMRVNHAIAMLRLGQWTRGLDELHKSLLLDPANRKIKAALADALAQAPPGTAPQWNDKN